MEKTATLNLRVNPTVKKKAEEVLDVLGIPMSTAISIYLNQIGLTGGIPFEVKIPRAPESVNMDMMTNEELHKKLDAGYRDAINGKTCDAAAAFENFRKGKCE